MAYRLTAQAIADLDEINQFIAVQKGNPRGAQVVEDYLFAAFEKLGTDPQRSVGKARPDITSRSVKFLRVRKYFVIYDDRGAGVMILAIVGGRQDLQRLLSEDPRYLAIDED